MAPWFQTPLGRYLLAWEQHQLEEVVADIFGFHALQVGLPELDGLAANRMPHRWLAAAQPADAAKPLEAPAAGGVSLCCDFDALPFDSKSLDLVLLTHALELARDPHLALAEVERVLRPEGRVVILGFNPASLWGAQRWTKRLVRRLGGASQTPALPAVGEFIGFRRMRDWLRLLSFEVEGGRFGCYRPPLAGPKWLARVEWMESAGERWWPVFGAVYLLVAVKRVRGMRLVGLVRDTRVPVAAAPAMVAQRESTPELQVERSALER